MAWRCNQSFNGPGQTFFQESCPQSFVKVDINIKLFIHMRKAQKNKIRRAVKKAWKEGRYKNAFRKKEKTMKPKIEMRKTESRSINQLFLFLENGERILVTCDPATLVTVVNRIQVAMNDYECLMLGGFASVTKLNKEGSVIDVVNGRKIIGYSVAI